MKKILALILIVACMTVFAACNFGSSDPGTDVEKKDDISVFANAIADMAPATRKVTLTWAGEFDYAAEATIVYNADGSAAIDYSYDVRNTIDVANPDAPAKTTVTGTATRAADGTLSDGAPTFLRSASGFKFNLDESKMNCTVSGNTLYASKIAQADTASVLGVSLASDATLTLVVSGGKLVSATVIYDDAGAVTYTMTYSYN